LSLLLRVRLGCKGFPLGQRVCGVVGKLCIHHRTEIRNDRQLEQDVERDPEDKTTSRRKRGRCPSELKPVNRLPVDYPEKAVR
jgi:hypothetical protein